jgi:GTP pyrophosphokinase
MTVADIAKGEPQTLLGRAYRFAEAAHKGQKRKSGEPYFSHCLATAEILAQWHLDETTIAAGLLHDTAEDTPVTLDELKKEFGEDIAFLVDGVTKLGRVSARGRSAFGGKFHDEAKVENMRKMIVAISQDLRVVFVKLADRLHNMRTLGYLPREKQKRIALETSEIYGQIASRLGMNEIAGELQDLAFPVLHPQEEKWIRENAGEQYEERMHYLTKVKPQLEAMLKEADLTPSAIDFRAKRHYSLYQKLLRYDMDVDKIYDLVAVRVIFKDIDDCYAALGAIHHAWAPLPGRIKDYIAMPKATGYRSLHTTVIGPEGKYLEIQLRTREMHEESEYGIAAHWVYKKEEARLRPASRDSGGQGGFGKRLRDALQWITQIKQWQERYRGAETPAGEFLDSMKLEFFRDRIFVITPKGDVIDLPARATPVDFAYRIHSEVGNTCVGAKINGQFAPLNHALQSGDMVEILTQKNKKPSRDWLGFVKTAGARDHIRAALREKHKALRSTSPTKAELRIAVKDRVGLIKDISGVIARSHLNIIGFHVDHTAGSHYPIDKILIATTDKRKIEKLLLKLKKIKEVREVSYRLC